MKNNQHRIVDELRGIILFVAVIWLVFIVDLFLPLEKLALLPRDFGGLIGILTMPFLHANWSHLIANSTPLLVLLALLAGSRANSAYTVIGIILAGGLLLWLFGRPVYVVGASGLVFGLMGFLIVSGLLERRVIPMIVSAVVGFTYGTTLFTGVLPNQPGISWDGHLFGAIGGVLVAFLLARQPKHRI